MRYYEIISTQSGEHLGVYQGTDAQDALHAMLVDAGAPLDEPDEALVAVDCTGEIEELLEIGHELDYIVAAGELPRLRRIQAEIIAEAEEASRDSATIDAAADLAYQVAGLTKLLTRAYQYLALDELPEGLLAEIEEAIKAPVEDGPGEGEADPYHG
jgi:hypothetical protein